SSDLEGVGVLGGADDDGVDVVGLVEEPAEVVVAPRPRVARRGPAEVVVVDVAQGDDVLAGDAVGVGGAAAAGADDGQVEPFVGGALLGRGAARGRPEAGPGQGRLLEEPAAGAAGGHGGLLWLRGK